jgi:HPt (histidine-containing phosphotransfer) domain-containing protein
MQSQNEHIQTVLASHPIEGVDYADGMKRFGDQATVYLRIIKSFIKNTPATLDELAGADPEALDDYAIRVHGLKGSCYGISAMTIGDEAKTLELASKAGDWATVEEGNPPLIARVNQLIAQLSQLVSLIEQTSPDAEDNRPLADAPSREQLRRLLDATQCFDVETLEQTIADMAQTRYRQDPTLAERLREQLTNFRYDLIEAEVSRLLG